ncbi:hypothetical protein [Brevibacillus reuszeri]|uniref:hypothetical protein n=1 Tax=Brevibacillus reuszeri TaxID=54915 RepID=UPI000CCC430B|nr:hypothetical protein [Brevibacillus reuszeri]
MTDFKTKFNEDTTALIAANIADRTERMAAVQALIDRYIEANGEIPDRAQLERLTDYVLREELTDPDPYKSEHNEYPILSEIQLSRRREGRRGSARTNIRGETPIRSDGDEDTTSDKHAPVGVFLASDGKDYRKPIRRTRGKNELIYMDEHAKIRNKQRAEQYKKDTSPGAVISYNLRETGGELTEPFVACREIGYRAVPEYYR